MWSAFTLLIFSLKVARYTIDPRLSIPITFINVKKDK